MIWSRPTLYSHTLKKLNLLTLFFLGAANTQSLISYLKAKL